jgi:hypothetical protein
MTSSQTSTPSDSLGSNGSPAVFSAEVLAFAAEHQAESCLQPLLEATHRIFPTARFVKVRVVEDPELRDNTQIVFHVQATGLSREESRSARKQWHDALLSLYRPTRHLLFCLRLDLKR